MNRVIYCRYCGKMIDFIKTANNEKMPVDLPMVHYSTEVQDKKDTVITDRGVVVKCSIFQYRNTIHNTKKGYRPHFVTCTHRKKGRRTDGGRAKAEDSPLQMSLF